MPDRFLNAATAQMSASALATDTTLTVAAGHGLVGGTPALPIVVRRDPPGGPGANPEFLRVVGNTATTLTVLRAQDGSTAVPFASGDILTHVIVASSLNALLDVTTRVTPTATKTAAYTAAVGDLVPGDTTTAAFTVTLPSTPSVGAQVGVYKVDSTANVLTILPAGTGTIDGDPNAKCLTKNAGATLEHIGSDAWKVVSLYAAASAPGALTASDASSTYVKGSAATVTVKASNSAANVRADFVCTGSGDETTINSAIAALGTNGGKVLLLAGTYNTAGSIVINRKDVVLSGEGMGFWVEFVSNMPTASAAEGLGMTKIKASASTYPLVKIDNTMGGTLPAPGRLNGIEVCNLYLYGASKSATTSVGISSNDVGQPTDMLSIHDVMVHNCYDGLAINADAPFISRNSLQDLGNRGIYLPLASGSGYTAVYPNVCNNVIADIGGYAVDCYAYNPNIHDNVIARTAGINLATRGGRVSGNTIWNSNGNAILWAGLAGFGLGGIISDNDIQVTSTSFGIAIQDGYQFVVQGNRISTTGGKGIEVTHCDACLIQGNYVRGTASSTTNMIDVKSTSNGGSIISGNRILQDTGTNSGNGLIVSGTGPYVITDNVVSGTITTKTSLPTASATILIANNLTY